jgi:hypothetical protein
MLLRKSLNILFLLIRIIKEIILGKITLMIMKNQGLLKMRMKSNIDHTIKSLPRKITREDLEVAMKRSLNLNTQRSKRMTKKVKMKAVPLNGLEILKLLIEERVVRGCYKSKKNPQKYYLILQEITQKVSKKIPQMFLLTKSSSMTERNMKKALL